MAELDTMIQNLYESSVKGVLPERQAQRMIQQLSLIHILNIPVALRPYMGGKEKVLPKK